MIKNSRFSPQQPPWSQRKVAVVDLVVRQGCKIWQNWKTIKASETLLLVTWTPTHGRVSTKLRHAHSHITRAVAAMDSCFGLVRPHQHGIAVAQKKALLVYSLHLFFSRGATFLFLKNAYFANNKSWWHTLAVQEIKYINKSVQWNLTGLRSTKRVTDQVTTINEVLSGAHHSWFCKQPMLNTERAYKR